MLTEWCATLIVRESAGSSVEHRRQLDAELCDASKLEGWGDKRIAAEAKKITVRLTRKPVERNAKAAESAACGSVPHPDTMTYVTVLLPVARKEWCSTPFTNER